MSHTAAKVTRMASEAQAAEGISVTLFDRSDPHEVVGWNPPNNDRSKHKPGDFTRLEDLRLYGRAGRTDIALVDQHRKVQYCHECNRGEYLKYTQAGFEGPPPFFPDLRVLPVCASWF